jgi:hypothetical protein
MPATDTQSPATLVAILVAARRAGDRDLERYARMRLERDHRIRVTFTKEPRRKDASQ